MMMMITLAEVEKNLSPAQRELTIASGNRPVR
jgi:hypothetical protein